MNLYESSSDHLADDNLGIPFFLKERVFLIKYSISYSAGSTTPSWLHFIVVKNLDWVLPGFKELYAVDPICDGVNPP